ncbi:unnamed protein product [Diatraea saccharalis]|uniref:Uncharacterized protein n=1 Tax=Diatraea saccharalis TaxID=40085 RepID=A0A9N9RAZ2_9NEOP|nr:unnamed protein product [Diatraea saccharalis]
MNGTNLPNMIDQQNLAVDDNFNDKRKKLLDFTEIKETNNEYNNNGIDKSDLKRKIDKNGCIPYITTELNINIEKDSNKTIRLELRHVANDDALAEFKDGNDEGDSVVHNGEIETFHLKESGNVRVNGDEDGNDAVSQNGDYGNESQENEVSMFLIRTFYF